MVFLHEEIDKYGEFVSKFVHKVFIGALAKLVSKFEEHGSIFLDYLSEGNSRIEDSLKLMAVVRVYLLSSGRVIAILDFHIGICSINDFDEDDKLLDVGIDDILESIFDNHSIVDYVYDEALRLYVGQLACDCFENV